jgi:hypothetical protein
VSDIGQSFPIQVAQIIVYDTSGQAHGWEVTGGVATWTWTGVGPTGRSTADVTITGGEFRRRTKHVRAPHLDHPPQGEIE